MTGGCATLALMPIAQERDVAFILNDRADLAADLGCDGVHIGQDDMPYAEARARLGRDAIIGVTCKASRDSSVGCSGGRGRLRGVRRVLRKQHEAGHNARQPGNRRMVGGRDDRCRPSPSAASRQTTPHPLCRPALTFWRSRAVCGRIPDGPAAGVRAVNAAIDAAYQLLDRAVGYYSALYGAACGDPGEPFEIVRDPPAFEPLPWAHRPTGKAFQWLRHQ